MHFALVDIQNVCAEAAFGLAGFFFADDQIDADVVFMNQDVGQTGDLFVERAFDFLTGEIPGMQHTPAIMAAFPSEIVQGGLGCRAGEVHAPVDEFPDSRRRFPDDELHDVPDAKTRAAGQRVLNVFGKAVGFIGHGGNAALSVVGV